MIPLRDNIRSRHWPLATFWLVAVNVGVFLLVAGMPAAHVEQLYYTFGFVPERFSAHWTNPVQFVPLFTSLFLHAGILHLIGNMWMLWIFGDNVEDRMGMLRFTVFFVLCGLAATALHYATNTSSAIPCVGASGAISGVLGAYFLLFPRARVVALVPIVVFIQVVEIPAILFIGLWFAIQIVSGLADWGGSEAGGVAWWAHIGGFLAGLVLCPFFLSERRTLRGHYRGATW